MGTPSFQANGPLSQSLNTLGAGNASSDPYITVFSIRSPTVNDIQYPVKKRWINTATITEYFLESFIIISGVTSANWVAINSATPTLLTLTGNTGGAVSPNLGNINVVGDGTTITISGNPATNTLTASLVGGSQLLQTLTPDGATPPGTSPVVPTGGTIDLFGAVVAAQSKPIKTFSDAANTIHIQGQLSSTSTSAAKTINNAGLSSFDSTIFTVDSGTGWVTLSGTGFVSSVTGDDGNAVTPSAGTITIKGATVANATNAKPVFTKENGAHEEDIQVQVAAAIASTNINSTGLAAFNSSQFTVDANGFVSITGGSGPVEKFAMQTGTSPVTATAAGLVTVNGAAVAAGTNPVESNGTGSNTYQIQVQTSQAIGSTNASNIGLSAFSNAQFTVDANGFVQMLHTPISKIVRQVFTSSGTYTPTAGMAYCNIEVVGGGGGGGGTAATTGTNMAAAGGGGGGGYASALFTAATIGGSQVVTIGTAGSGGAAGGVNAGTTGGTTSVGILISGTGGLGGAGSGQGATPTVSGVGGAGGTGTVAGSGIGGYTVSGEQALSGILWGTGSINLSGDGGPSFYGTPARGGAGSSNGGAGRQGGGGAGAAGVGTNSGQTGGNGGSGLVIILEYCWA